MKEPGLASGERVVSNSSWLQPPSSSNGQPSRRPTREDQPLCEAFSISRLPANPACFCSIVDKFSPVSMVFSHSVLWQGQVA